MLVIPAYGYEVPCESCGVHVCLHSSASLEISYDDVPTANVSGTQSEKKPTNVITTSLATLVWLIGVMDVSLMCHVQDKLLSITSMGQVATIYGTSQRGHLLWHLRQMLLWWWHHFYTNTLTNHPLFSCRHHTLLSKILVMEICRNVFGVFLYTKSEMVCGGLEFGQRHNLWRLWSRRSRLTFLADGSYYSELWANWFTTMWTFLLVPTIPKPSSRFEIQLLDCCKKVRRGTCSPGPLEHCACSKLPCYLSMVQGLTL